MTAKKRKAIVEKINFWKMLRDVLIAAMSKGQLPLATVALLFIIMILKMPGEDVSKLAFNFLALLGKGGILGGVLFVLSLTGWAIHAKWQRRVFGREVDRLAHERNNWQRKVLGEDKVQSSKE